MDFLGTYITDYIDLTNTNVNVDIDGYKTEYEYDNHNDDNDDGEFNEDGLVDFESWWWMLRMSMMYTGRWIAK